MKITAALVALAAAVAAPLASAEPAVCTVTANANMLNALTVTSKIKRTTVNGGARIVNAISIKNNAASAATGLQFSTLFDADTTFLKGNARVFGAAKPTLTAAGNNIVPVITSSVFSIPAHKTLKATISYKAANCAPAANNPHTLGGVSITIPADGSAGSTCTIDKIGTAVTYNRKKNCPAEPRT